MIVTAFILSMILIMCVGTVNLELPLYLFIYPRFLPIKLNILSKYKYLLILYCTLKDAEILSQYHDATGRKAIIVKNIIASTCPLVALAWCVLSQLLMDDAAGND